jgi:hypothetical protein
MRGRAKESKRGDMEEKKRHTVSDMTRFYCTAGSTAPTCPILRTRKPSACTAGATGRGKQATG